jgi:excisionase family DNA binding protein
MTSKDFLTTGEAARLVNISRSTISLLRQRHIPGQKPDHRERMISRELDPTS